MQGRFMQPGVSLNSLMLGSDFARPLVLPASPLLTSAALWLVRKMGGGVQLEPHGASPHVFAPLIAAAQVVNVARPGSEPVDLCCVQEDMTCFDASLKCRSGACGCAGVWFEGAGASVWQRRRRQHQRHQRTRVLAYVCPTPAGHPLPHAKRRGHFAAASHRVGRCFDTEHVWTFQVRGQGNAQAETLPLGA
jgi:hypothetical protein